METGLLPSPSTAPLLHGPKKRTYFSVYHHSLFFYKRAAKGFSDKPRYPSILWTAWHTAHLAERCHEGGYLAVVGCIHVGSSLDQQLHHIKVATVSSEPQRGVPLLISHVNVSPSTLTERKEQHEMTIFWREDWLVLYTTSASKHTCWWEAHKTCSGPCLQQWWGRCHERRELEGHWHPPLYPTEHGPLQHNRQTQPPWEGWGQSSGRKGPLTIKTNIKVMNKHSATTQHMLGFQLASFRHLLRRAYTVWVRTLGRLRATAHITWQLTW